jgi:hypothetical protein
MLSVFVYDREKYFSRLPPPPRWMRFITKPQRGPGAIEILFNGLTPSRDEVLEYLRQHYPHKILHPDDSSSSAASSNNGKAEASGRTGDEQRPRNASSTEPDW